ncbi:hypothetical protein ACFQ3Z_44765 [Streptomyces nogalater]
MYPSEFRYLFAYIPALVGYGTVVFDKWAWHWPVIHRFTGRSWVTGTWRVVLVPSPESHIPEGGNRGPITTYMTIEQTFWSLHATLRTKESTSRSSNATISAPENSGTAEIGFLYDNTPRVEHQHRSPRHEGACRIAVTGLRPKAATGHYYTSRFTAATWTSPCSTDPPTTAPSLKLRPPTRRTPATEEQQGAGPGRLVPGALACPSQGSAFGVRGNGSPASYVTTGAGSVRRSSRS